MTDNPRRLNRPAIWRDCLNKGVDLEITLKDARFLVPHDALHAWVGANTRALATLSWTDRGHYSWPTTSVAMRAFLEPYRLRPP